jgi:diguanylate cyclase (GGDEF)-like protein
MGLRPIRIDTRTESSWLRVCVATVAVAVAAGLAFLSGLAISRQGPEVSAGTVAITGLLVTSIVVAQFVVQLFALIWAGKVHHVARLGKAELAARNDQLWLINRLCSLLERENGRRSVAGRVIEFCFEEFDVTSVVYWGTNSYGAPQGPELSRSGTSQPQVKLPDTQRAVLARNAARDGVAIVIDESGQPRTLDPAGPPVGAFALFMPLRGDDITEGVLEVNGTPPAVRFGRWQVVPLLAEHVGAALQRGRAYEQLQERAEEDYVTGLFNHGYMQAYLEKAIPAADESGQPLAVLFLDVNNFKSFNDTLGHGAGDKVLQTVADELRLMTEGVGVVGRSGGDEFMIILPGHSADEAETFTQAFQDWLSESAPAVNGIYRIRVSCGFAVYPVDAHSRHELLAAADARLYKNKRQNTLHSRAGVRVDEGPGMGVYGLLDSIVESVHSKDAYSRAHSERMADYAGVLARHLGLSSTAQKTLRLAALLHDVGKIGVPEALLRKPGPLNEHEFEIVKHQLSIAQHLIVDIPNAREVRTLVLLHHERWDGKGYPRGLRGEEIPYLARLLAVADAFAAITLDRPYRCGVPVEDALREMRQATGQFDPAVLDAFSEALAMSSPATPALAIAAPSGA